MPVPTLVIGVGGTGVRVLLRVKERYVEAYDELPSSVILLELDTDQYVTDKGRIKFNDVELVVANDIVNGRKATDEQLEYYQVCTRNREQSIDSIFKKSEQEWKWVDRARLTKTVTEPGSTTVHAGAATVRPIGRAALFLDYDNTYQQIRSRFRRLLSLEPGQQRAANVFVTASVAGGSGAGMVIDILRMIEHIRQEPDFQSKPVVVTVLLVGGSSFVERPDDQRTLSNTYAALRELDRLGAVTGKNLVRYVPSVLVAPPPVGRLSSRLGPADHILLFDRPDRLGRSRGVSEDFLNRVVTPTISDYIVAVSDTRLASPIGSIQADYKENFKKGIDGKRGHYPYMSAGSHTLIFPERDVRRSAGFKLLRSLWDETLVRPKEQEDFDRSGSELPTVSANLWGNLEGIKLEQLIPYNFAQVGFSKESVCSTAGNNNFIRTVVTSAINGEINIPGKYQFLWIERPMLERVWMLIGEPKGMQLSVEAMSAKAQRIAEKFKESINQLENASSAEQIRLWRERYLGPGALGAEKSDRGLWMHWLQEEDSIQGHKKDFADVLQNVVQAILNDRDELGRILPYRLEYARRVLDRLDQLIDMWLFSANPNDKTSPSLLTSYFNQQVDRESETRGRVNSADTHNFGNFRTANINYARAKMELAGKNLLEMLCNFLKEDISKLQTELDEWRDYLRLAGIKIGENQSEHERNRRIKEGIPVRTYVTNPKIEEELYSRYKDSALDAFRKKISWTQADQFSFYVKDAVFARPMPDLPQYASPQQIEHARQQILLKVDDLVTRSINWACTTKGNADRPDLEPALKKLGSVEDVRMAKVIEQWFGPGNGPSMVEKMTSDRELAALCFLPNWPAERRIYVSCLPTSSSEQVVEDFHRQVEQDIRNRTTNAVYNERAIRETDPENPRHAVAMELAVGFRLQDRQDYQVYLNTYRNDNDNGYALHCLPEESVASNVFEPALHMEPKPQSEAVELYGDLGPIYQLGIQLNPMIVDVLGNRRLLEMFVKARTFDIIAPIRSESGVLGDFYLYPTDPNARIRLSRMTLPEEIDEIVDDVVFSQSRKHMLQEGIEGQKLLGRLRLLQALRTFTLYQTDIDAPQQRRINYEALEKRINEELTKHPDVKPIYQAKIDNFKSFFTDYCETEDNLEVLAHMGLVLAKVAYDLKKGKQTYSADEIGV